MSRFDLTTIKIRPRDLRRVQEDEEGLFIAHEGLRYRYIDSQYQWLGERSETRMYPGEEVEIEAGYLDENGYGTIRVRRHNRQAEMWGSPLSAAMLTRNV